MKFIRILCAVGLSLAVLRLAAWGAPQQETRKISLEQLRDRIEGGWAGQMIGVSYGLPTEHKWQSKVIEVQWEEWKPELVARALTQDDLYGDMGFLRTLEVKGIEATSADFGATLKDSRYHLAHANLAARRALRRGVPAAESGSPRCNVHANDIDFQMDADGLGLITPGLPQLGGALAARAGRVVSSGDGLCGGLFVAGMYAAAYFETDPRKVVEAGLAGIPAQSSYARLIADVLHWSQEHPADWQRVWQLVQDKWDKNHACPEGALEPFNIDAHVNGANIVLGLLYGGSDFGRVIDIATRGGHDSDCNPANAGGIWGVMHGFRQIPARYRSGIPAIADRKFSHTDYTFSSVVESTLKLALAAVTRTGGRVEDGIVTVKLQSPQPARMEMVDFGKPVERVPITDSRWVWKGNWLERTGKGNIRFRVSAEKGAAAEIAFNGTGAMVGGPFLTTGGLFEVRLDGAPARSMDAYDDQNRYPEAIWHCFNLPPGKHTLRIVVRGETYPGSQGAEVGVHDLVIFRQ